jgi:hypothetical protein
MLLANVQYYGLMSKKQVLTTAAIVVCTAGLASHRESLCHHDLGKSIINAAAAEYLQSMM